VGARTGSAIRCLGVATALSCLGWTGCGASPQETGLTLGFFELRDFIDCAVPVPGEVRFENHSTDAERRDAPVDPSRPSVVLIHGWNGYRALLGCGAYVWPARMAEALRPVVGESANILVINYDVLAWQRDQVLTGLFKDMARDFARFCRSAGVDHDLHVIAHSAGAELACDILTELGFLRQLTLLDGPDVTRQRLLADWAGFLERVGLVENYWVSRPFGIGADLPSAANVCNILLLSGYANNSAAVHFAPVSWYRKTITDRAVVGGFGWSFIAGAARAGGTDFIESNGLLFARPADGSMSGWTDDLQGPAPLLRRAMNDGLLRPETAAGLARDLGLVFVGP